MTNKDKPLEGDLRVRDNLVHDAGLHVEAHGLGGRCGCLGSAPA